MLKVTPGGRGSRGGSLRWLQKTLRGKSEGWVHFSASWGSLKCLDITRALLEDASAGPRNTETRRTPSEISRSSRIKFFSYNNTRGFLATPLCVCLSKSEQSLGFNAYRSKTILACIHSELYNCGSFKERVRGTRRPSFRYKHAARTLLCILFLHRSQSLLWCTLAFASRVFSSVCFPECNVCMCEFCVFSCVYVSESGNCVCVFVKFCVSSVCNITT